MARSNKPSTPHQRHHDQTDRDQASRPYRARWSKIGVLLLSPTLIANSMCECTDDGPTTPALAACPTLAVTPQRINAQAGGIARAYVELGNFDELALGGAVDLDPSQAPLPTTASPARLNQSQTLSEMTVTVPQSTPAGRYTQPIRVSYSGLKDTCTNPPSAISFDVDVAVSEPQSFTVSADPTSLDMQQGDSASTTLTITREGGFSAAVAVDVSGLPAGLPAGVSARVGDIAANSDSTTLTLIASDEAVAGTAYAQVTLSGPGVDSRTLILEFTVTERPDFSFVLEPDSQTVYRGRSGDPVAVRVTRVGGFDGEIALALDGVPPSVTASVTAPGAGDSGSITFAAAAADTAQGSTEITVTASTEQVGEKTRSFTLTVLPPPALFLSVDPFVRTDPNTTASVEIEIERISWQGEVTTTVTRAPAGITATVSPETTDGNLLTVELQVGDVTPGDYEVELLASADNGLTATVVLYIAVTDPGDIPEAIDSSR